MKPFLANNNILLIDPHYGSGNALKRRLTTHGFNVTIETGKNPLPLYEQLKPAFVFCYIKSAGATSGYDIIKEIISKHPDALIIATSYQFKQTYSNDAIAAGAKGYIAKAQLDTEDAIVEYLEKLHELHTNSQ